MNEVKIIMFFHFICTTDVNSILFFSASEALEFVRKCSENASPPKRASVGDVVSSIAGDDVEVLQCEATWGIYSFLSYICLDRAK